MQWINKSQFHGQVKTAGLEKSMQWKTGNVDFDYDPETDTWKVKLFFKVNPNRASHEILIKNSVSLSLKCGRLIVDDKNGDGIHIKLTSNDVASAKALISQIQKSEPIGQSHNKAEVGLTSKASILYKKGTENVSPPDHSLLLTNQQKVTHNGEVKARMPTHGPTSTPNQALKSNRIVKTDPNQNGLCTDEEDMDLEASATHGKFTGVKDIATRAPNLHNGPSVASGLGTKRFYGSQSTSTFDHPNKEIKNTQATSSSEDRSPKLKRAKLTDGYNSPTSSSLAGSYSQGKMPLVVPDASRGSPQEEEVTLVQAEGGDASQRTVGFDNLGNTCFMNSPLQCLSSLEPLSIDFQSAVMEYGLDLKANSITRLLYLLMKDVRKLDACPERVRQILTRLRHDINRKFALNTQQDAHELLAELLDRTDEEMKQVMRHRNMEALENASSSASNFSNMSPGTPIETNFMWFYKTSFFFHECKTEVISQHEEKDTTLMLALDSNKDSNLQDCIDRYFESSEVDMRCEKCGKEEKATMTRKIVRRPRIFIMNLLRYQTDNAESKKKMDKVAISSYTSVAEYCAEDVKAPPFMEPLFMFEREDILTKRQSFSPPHSSADPVSQGPFTSRTDGYTSSPWSHALPRAGFDMRKRAMDDLCSDSSLDCELIHLKPSVLGSFAESARNQPFPLLTLAINEGDSGSIEPKEIQCIENFNAPLASFQDTFCGMSPPDSGGSDTESSAFSLNRQRKKCFRSKKSSKSPEESLDSWKHLKLEDKPQPIGHHLKRMNTSKPYDPYINTWCEDMFYTSVSEAVTRSPSPVSSNEKDEMPPLLPPLFSIVAPQYQLCPYGADHLATRIKNRVNTLMSCNPKQKSHGDLPDLIVPAVRCEMSCSSSLTIDTGSNPDSPMKEVSKQPLVKKVVLVDPKKGDGCDADVKLLVQTLIEKFWEVEKYIHEFGGDLDYLYVETRSVISEVNQFVEQMKKSVEDVEARSKTPETSDQDSGYLQENQGALCHSLINRALHDDTSANELDGFLDTHDCTLICNEILSTRYNAYTKEDKKVDHFIEDLGLYLAAKRLGIAKPDTPKKTKGQTQSASVFQDSACNTRIPREREDSQCAEAGSDEEVSFKKEVTKEKVELEDGTQLIPGFQMDTLWCETDKDKRTPKIECEPVDASSFGGTGLRQTEHQYFNPESSANLLLGKDVGLYTEAELQTIDVSSLTEDEMMLYAQALSKLEYMKENGSLANEDDMELCDMDDKPIVDPMLSGGPLLEHHSDEDWVGVDVSGCKPQCTETCTELNQQSKQLSPSHELSDKNLKLICDEDLCDFDEIDGAKGSRQKKSKNREWPEDSQHNWLELESTIPKYCDFCNEVFEGECLSCSVMNQPSMDESPPPPYESGSSSGKSSTDSKQSAPRVLSDKCNTPPDNSKKMSNSKDVSPVTSDSAKVASDLAASEKAYKQTDDNDHVVPSLPALCSSSKVDKFFSPSKPNNLTKSRDYSRLRSPSASPRKRNKVNVKSSSASKRLLFPGDDRGERSEGSSYLDDGPPFHDLSRDLDTSLEVNIGESSFDTRDESFMTPVSSYTRVGLPCTPFSPMGRQPGSSSHANSTPKGSTSAKQDSKLGNIQQMDMAHSGPAQVLQINQSQADLVKDQKDPTSCAVPQKDIGTKEKSQDLIRDKTQTLGKSKLSRYSYTSSSNTEEKENDPADQAKNVRMENIEMGKADFSYRLVGIVNHHGESLFAGHYTAFAYNLSKQKWFYMDDKHTKETSETTAKRESLHSGYVFFYMDKDLFHEYEAKVRRTSGMKT
ncbi:ubiquitin carboxyl-terminal hydrolase 37 [Biomphalaria glabrata]|nr:ubiquitin carboxyl-terminal hydrolase 37 [Biomphalaria glabrata]